MSTKPKIVFKLTDVPFIESPDKMMRNRVMVTETNCGSKQYSAGLFYVRPGSKSHSDKHPGTEELYYIFAGHGKVVIDGEPNALQAGDVVFIPDGAEHYLVNDGSDTLGLFWAIAKRWSDLKEIQHELSGWHKIKTGSDWGPSSPA